MTSKIESGQRHVFEDLAFKDALHIGVRSGGQEVIQIPVPLRAVATATSWDHIPRDRAPILGDRNQVIPSICSESAVRAHAAHDVFEVHGYRIDMPPTLARSLSAVETIIWIFLKASTFVFGSMLSALAAAHLFERLPGLASRTPRSALLAPIAVLANGRPWGGTNASAVRASSDEAIAPRVVNGKFYAPTPLAAAVAPLFSQQEAGAVLRNGYADAFGGGFQCPVLAAHEGTIP